MAQTVGVSGDAEDRERLTAVIGDRNRPHKHVQRDRIILLSAERLPAALTCAKPPGEATGSARVEHREEKIRLRSWTGFWAR